MKIIIDPGHGGKDSGGGSNSHWLEKDMNLKISLYQYKRFKELGIDVELTRHKDIYLSPTERTNIVKKSGASICISNHINAGGGEGAETIHSIYSDGKLANMIMDELVIEGQKKRRVFCRESTKYKGKDYYFMHRETGKVQTVIVEYGFADNEEDTKKILNNWQNYAEAVVRAVCKYINHSYKPVKKIDYKQKYFELKKGLEELLSKF
ncbi:N-acetylmuramoyl-L-alanine amidase family protein [Caminicella sporogenes]|uniref:N-acetylmuramoyl-L-alanine amidase family protein n=1 Tax=Caminicella sporogenes TaxID=166485 RepID=UPI00253F8C15|nr:N-acetylmuramoyl-L-alanine amidase [Caminicella sporogenes]WIF94319.1 N-acetylmuramoyl-L-alanine amidase [Caminicella sporogenes]